MSTERTFDGADQPVINAEVVSNTNEMLTSAADRAAAEQAEQAAWRTENLPSYRQAEARGEWVPNWARSNTNGLVNETLAQPKRELTDQERANVAKINGNLRSQDETRAEHESYGKTAIEFLRQERETILNAANPHGEIDPNHVNLHETYLNGRKDGYNALRETLLMGAASLGHGGRDIPEAIEVDQIRVRQQQQELEIEDRQQVLEL